MNMERLKEKMLNYEEEPPQGNWEAIASKLNTDEMIIPIRKKTNKRIYYTIAVAAAVALVVFVSALWFNRSPEATTKQLATNNRVVDTLKAKQNPVPHQKNDNTALTGKHQELKVNNPANKNNLPLNNQPQNTVANNQPPKDEITIPDIASKKYITISGPEGQPVKISSKAASLIESSDDQFPPKPVWNKKISKWKDIMQANSLAPSSGNLIDIVELSHTLKGK